jgi:hypothetical protein
VTPFINLIEVDRKFIELLASKETGSHSPMRDALEAAKSKLNPVFVKRKTSILVMEREQFNEIQQTIGGKE